MDTAKKLTTTVMSPDGQTKTKETSVISEHTLNVIINEQPVYRMISWIEWVELSKRVDDGWGRAGVVCVSKPFKSNEYIRNGKEITRKQALQHIGF